jgi:hypothetical protein
MMQPPRALGLIWVVGHIKHDLVRDYKSWFETTAASSTQTAPQVKPELDSRPALTLTGPLVSTAPDPSTAKTPATGVSSTAHAVTGKEMAQSKRLGKGKVIQVLDSVRQPSAPPVATLAASDADLVSSWSMPEDYQEGQGFRTSVIAEASPAGWITVPRKGRKVSFAVAVRNPTPPQQASAIYLLELHETGHVLVWVQMAFQHGFEADDEVFFTRVRIWLRCAMTTES